MKTKLCRGCSTNKPWGDYLMHKSGRQEGKPFSRCKECELKQYHLNKFEYFFNISLEDWSRLLEVQGGCCAACKRPFQEGWSMKPETDHDHETLLVRGILCGDCNSALGRVRDDKETLLALVQYLEEPPSLKLWPEGKLANLRANRIRRKARD